jgi:hypothetical protein
MTKTNVSVTPKTCLCGCGIQTNPKNPKVRFVPGHDAILKAKLIQQALSGDEGAKKQLKTLGWDHFLVGAKAKHNGPCRCGCGYETKNGSKFLPGHDAKLKSRLVMEAMEGNPEQQKSARKELAELNWTRFLQAAEWKLKRDQEERAKLEAAKAATKDA